MNASIVNPRGIVVIMKKTKPTHGARQPAKLKLALRLEHIAQLTMDQLGQVAGGSEISCGDICSKPH